MEIPQMKELAKQYLDFQKSAFNNLYNSITMIQEQAGKFGATFIEQNPLIPPQMKNQISAWSQMNQEKPMEMPQMKELAKQYLDFQKSAFNNLYDSITMIQEQAEKLGTTFIEQNPLIPQHMKYQISAWNQMCRKAREDYKKAVDDGFDAIEKNFTITENR